MTAPVAVVVGSLHYDIMVEAPDRPRKGETVTGTAWRPKFGGKGGNQAVAAARSGASVRMAGAVGVDDFGRFLLDRLANEGIDSRRVTSIAGVCSGMSVAITDESGDYGAVIVSGANAAFDPELLNDPTLWQEATVLVLQNEMPDRVNTAAATAAKARGMRVLLNAAPYRPIPTKLADCVDVLIVNAIEAEQLCGGVVDDLASAARAAEMLARSFPAVVVTAGGQGVVGMVSGEAPIVVPARAVEVVSTHGAGDVFVGTLAAALARDLSLADGLELSNSASAEHVSRTAGPVPSSV